MPRVPGTGLSRCRLDNSLCSEHGIIPTGREATLVWVLGLGPPTEPKLFYYGSTIEQALSKAEEALL